uniref:Uncharacterized protein n=1 Tax=Tanacetum cinerariifolium TaxID=118510 RepID=A0A699IWT6_TANCI|nr:hypothetical protein [Tanacetum cinerariifolium]
MKKFDYVTKGGAHIYLTKEQINEQKRMEEDAKAEAAKQEGEVRIAQLVDLLGLEVVQKYYNDKLQYDRYCDKILNRRAELRITNSDVLTKRVQLHIKCTERMVQVKLFSILKPAICTLDHLDKLNDLAKKKRKHVGDIYDYFKSNKRLKQDFVTIKDQRDFLNTMLYTVQEIFFRCHQGLGLDDHARTFSALLLAEVEKRNLNPLKQIRTIEQLRQ